MGIAALSCFAAALKQQILNFICSDGGLVDELNPYIKSDVRVLSGAVEPRPILGVGGINSVKVGP